MADQVQATRRVTATPDGEGLRVDIFLSRALPDISRSRIQQLIKAGQVTRSGRQLKSGAVVGDGDVFDIAIPDIVRGTPVGQDIPLSILFEDDDIVVIDKPVGMVVHPAAGHAEGTLVNALLHHIRGLSGIGGVERPGIVHRLDRGTSGVMIVAKHDQAHRSLSAQFHDRTVTKEYLALVWGRPSVGLVLDRPIGRHPVNRQKMSSRARHGRSALTTVVQVDAFYELSLVRVSIGTGRTHQIRVHLSEAGFPIVGDELYGGVRRARTKDRAVVAALKRPFLHSARLTVRHPQTGKPITFEAPLDHELAALVAYLRNTELEPATSLDKP
jgi:23S rRNA pseudouridine1911/1915/1917 synthase